MRLNLRKAVKLRKEIEGWLASGRFKAEAEINVDEPAHAANPSAVVEAARSAALSEVERQIAASSLLARLRKAIGAANVGSGVDAILADAADVDRRIRFLSALKVERPSKVETSESLSAKIVRLREGLAAKASGTGHFAPSATTISVGFLDEGTVATATARIAELRREKEALEDKRLGLNATVEIEIGEDDVNLLREIGLI